MIQLPPWPAQIPRIERPIARFAPAHERDWFNYLALQRAKQIEERSHSIKASNTTGTWQELMWVNSGDYTAVASSASEASLLAGINDQPVLPALFFFNKVGRGRTISLLTRGVFSTTSTPTLTFQVRLGTTSGSSFLSGTSVGVSAAITSGSSVTNKAFELRLDLTCYSTGIGSGSTTLSGAGYIISSGFASPFWYPLEPTTPDTGTWTATIDNSVTQYMNVSMTWSSSSSSNTITAKQVMLWGLN